MTLSLAIQILVSLLVFGSVFMLIWTLFRYPVPASPPVHRRIAHAVGAAERQTMFDHRWMAPAMSFAIMLAGRFGFPALRRRIARDLNAAGNPNGYSVEQCLAICIASAALLGSVATALAWLMAPGTAPTVLVVMTLLGFAGPLWSLHRDAIQRLTRIAKNLPYALDLISLMMTAGCTFSEAVESLVADDPDEDLHQELQIVRSEIEFGSRRAVALQRMADRIPLDAVRSVVGAINQSEQLGTPLSVILNAQSGMIRMHRSVRAEKLSASASLRILVPSVLILVAAVIVVFAPFVRPMVASFFS